MFHKAIIQCKLRFDFILLFDQETHFNEKYCFYEINNLLMAGDLSVHQRHAFCAYDSVLETEDDPPIEALDGAEETWIQFLALCDLVQISGPQTSSCKWYK